MWIPLSLAGGITLAYVATVVTGIWIDYSGAVILPVLGLTGAWILAPSYRMRVCLCTYLVGVGLVWLFFTPSLYPEGHPQAYEPTYVPFALTCAVGVVFPIVICRR